MTVYSNEIYELHKYILLAHHVRGGQKFICVTHYLCIGLNIGNYRRDDPIFVLAQFKIQLGTKICKR